MYKKITKPSRFDKMTKMNKMWKTNKTKKCQPFARDRPDLIQTVFVPDKGLARPHKKINRTEKIKTTKRDYKHVPLVMKDKLRSLQSNDKIKTKKCQPFARDRPDLIQTVFVPDKGLARPHKKINRTKKIKSNKRDYKHVPLAMTDKRSLHSNDKIKTKKCQPFARDRPDLIQTVFVPDKGLARPHKKINRTKKIKSNERDYANVTLVKSNKLTKTSLELANTVRKVNCCQEVENCEKVGN